MQSVKGSSPCIGAAALAVAVALVAGSGSAAAHPHVWIDARFAVIFDGQRRMAALRQSWRFDEFYSLFAVEGLDKDGDGALAPGELRPLAELNVTSLKEYNYFTEITADGAALSFSTVSAYEARYEDAILTPEFTVPLAATASSEGSRVGKESARKCRSRCNPSKK